MRLLPRALAAGLTGLLGLALARPFGAGERELSPDAPALSLRKEEPSDLLQKARARGYATLDDCFQAATRRSERTARAEEDYLQARLLKVTARGAVLPRVTLEDNYYRQNSVSLPGCTSGGFACTDTRNQALLRLEQPIFSGFRDRSFLAFSANNTEAFRYRAEDARRVLYGSLAQVFYSALQREGEVKTLEDSLTVERERFREIQARHEAGLARKTEVLLVQSQLAEDESKLTRARNELQVVREQLSFLMAVQLDLPLHDDPDVPGSAEKAFGNDSVAPALDERIREAAAQRSDVREREKSVEAARYQVLLARGEYYPTLSLEADAILSRQNYSPFAQETDWTAEVDLSFPLFDGGRIRANVATAQSKLRQAILERDELVRQVGLEVQSAWLTFRSDGAQLATLEASVASADENDRLVREEYRNGLATNLEVITGHNQLLSSRLELEHQRYQVKLDWVALRLAQGLLPGTSSPPSLPSAAAPPAGGDASRIP